MRQPLLQAIAAQSPGALAAAVVSVSASRQSVDVMVNGSIVPGVPVLSSWVDPSPGMVALVLKMGGSWVALGRIPAPDATRNLLINGGFEASEPGAVVPVGWSSAAFTGGGSELVVASGGRTGNSSVRGVLSAGATQYLAPEASVPVTAGAAYDVEVWSMATAPLSGGEAVRLSMWSGGAADLASPPGTDLVTVTPLTGAWSATRATWIAPGSAGDQVWVRLAIAWVGGSASRGTSVFVDDVSMVEAS